MSQYQNKPPIRPDAREPIYDIVDGECDHLAEALADGAPIGEFLALLSTRIRQARTMHVEGEAAAVVAAQNAFRDIAGLAVRAMETHGTLPREYRVPPSANIVGTLDAHDLGDTTVGA